MLISKMSGPRASVIDMLMGWFSVSCPRTSMTFAQQIIHGESLIGPIWIS